MKFLAILLSLFISLAPISVETTAADAAVVVNTHHKPGHHDNGKHKGYNVRKPKRNHYSPPKNQSKRNYKPKANNTPPVKNKNRPNKTKECKPKVITKTKKVYVEVPDTKIEKVFYGTGIVATAVLLIGILAAAVGFVVGWWRRSRDEDKFIDDLLDK